jgi:hypothetical protein
MDIAELHFLLFVYRCVSTSATISLLPKRPKTNYLGVLSSISSSNGVNDLKPGKFGVITLLLFGMVIALTGIVCADQPVPAVPETQTLGTITTADVEGIAMETDAASWTISSGGIPISGTDPLLAGYPGWSSWPDGYGGFLADWDWWLELEEGPNFPHLQDMLEGLIDTPGGARGNKAAAAQSLLNWLQTQGSIQNPTLNDQEIRYTTAYDANIVAQGGHTAFTKTMTLDTRNKVIGQSNLKAQTGLTYAATDDGGNVVGSENLMIDGAGMPTKASDRMLCPFSSQPVDVIPAYCNIVQAGSKYDLTIGSVTTDANDRFVGTDATNPVVLNYDINIKPYTASGTQVPARGSAMAYIKAHIQESRNMSTIPDVINQEFTYPDSTITIPPSKAEDLTYSETSSANGYIYSFNKVIAYQSGKSLL